MTAAAHARRSSLTGKVALVTGAYQGIGLAIAQAMAAAGAEIVLADRNPLVAERAAAMCEAGAKAHAMVCDVTSPDDIEQLFQTVLAKAGRLDILVNNAGILTARPALELELADWTRVIDTNLTACFSVARAAALIMRQQGGGAIVNLSSIVGRVARPGLAAYAAAKAGIDGLTRALACDLAGTGVTVNAIAPGMIMTEMSRSRAGDHDAKAVANVPARRWGTPEDIAGVAVFLATEAAAYINGQVIYVDGGFTAVGR